MINGEANKLSWHGLLLTPIDFLSYKYLFKIFLLSPNILGCLLYFWIILQNLQMV